jgi:thioesterase DpgC
MDVDAREMDRHIRSGEDLLTELPPKQERSTEQQESAEEIHNSCRNVRSRFMRAHNVSVYATLTDGGRIRARIDELSFHAANFFPSLVPTEAQIVEECGKIQLHKEGREIDQGIFFGGLLQSHEIGVHLMTSMRRPTARALQLLPDFLRTGELNLGSVLIERRAQAGYVTIQNQQFLNAEDNRLTEDLETAVDLTLLDEGIRVGVLRGAIMTHRRYLGKRVFSSGLNLIRLYEGQISFIDFLLKRELGFISKIMRGLSVEDWDQSWNTTAVEKPWLAAVDSFAIGGGAQLLFVFDRVIAAADSYISLPAANEGIVPGAGNLRLGRFSGSRIARQIILGGRKIWASESDAQLFFDEVVDPSEMDSAIEANVSALDSTAVAANRRMLNLAEEPLDHFRTYMAAFALDQACRIYDPEILTKLEQRWKRKE